MLGLGGSSFGEPPTAVDQLSRLPAANALALWHIEALRDTRTSLSAKRRPQGSSFRQIAASG